MVQSQEVSQVPALSLPASLSADSVAATELRPWGSFTVLEEGARLQNQAD